MTTIAVIGVGHMGSAIIKGLKNNPENYIIAENPVNPRASKLAEKLDFELVNTLSDLIANIPVAVNTGTIGLFMPEKINQSKRQIIIDFLDQCGND